MNKSPAFQFYANDWLSSTKIALMTPEQEGAYIRLLCHAWNSDDCGLPSDDEQLSILSRLNEGWFKGGSTVVRKCFTEIDGRLYNERLLKERKKQENWRKKSSEGGKLSAKLRNDKQLSGGKGGSRVVDKCLTNGCNQKATLQSSSSSSNNIIFSAERRIFEGISTQDKVDWSKAYPAVDIELEINKAVQWILANPKKQKKNYRRFLNNWFARVQEKGGYLPSNKIPVVPVKKGYMP